MCAAGVARRNNSNFNQSLDLNTQRLFIYFINISMVKISGVMLLLSHSLPEREGGGGAPTFLCVGICGVCGKSRAGAGDRPAGAL